MLKKILTGALVLVMMFGLVGCNDKDEILPQDKSDSQETKTKKEREFTESPGLIKYFTINDEKICLPETVGEYVKYLEKLGTKVELGDTGKSINEADEMKAGEISSMVAYLKVYLSDDKDDWQWFGIRYENRSKKACSVADAKVTQITLAYDLYSEHEDKDHRNKFKSIVFVLNDDQEIKMNGRVTYDDISDMIGYATQNTDGHLKYTDDQGYTYKMDTENKKGILGEMEIVYPVE